MTWFVEDKRTWAQRFFGNVLKSGPLPKHVALIMDGNRRYARFHHMKKIEGHRSGFEKLLEVWLRLEYIFDHIYYYLNYYYQRFYYLRR